MYGNQETKLPIFFLLLFIFLIRKRKTIPTPSNYFEFRNNTGTSDITDKYNNSITVTPTSAISGSSSLPFSDSNGMNFDSYNKQYLSISNFSFGGPHTIEVYYKMNTDTTKSFERIYESFPRLAERKKQEAVTLSGGEQQMLAVARALARDLKLLMLDEPYEGLAPVIREEIARIVADIRDLGITTIIVEQDAMAVLQYSDRAVILDSGEIAFLGSAAEVRDNKQLREQYLAV